jgi:hypothetical protein
VCRQLGFTNDQQQRRLSDNPMDKYTEFFSKPLVQEHVCALAALLGKEMLLEVTTCPKESPSCGCGLILALVVLPYLSASMDSSNVLIWNVGGLNDRGHGDTVWKVVDSCKPILIGPQETRFCLPTSSGNAGWHFSHLAGWCVWCG